MKKKKILMIIGCFILAALLAIPEVRALVTDTSEPINVCESGSFLRVLYMVKVGFTIIKYGVPLILIVSISLDVYNLVMDPSNNKKVFPLIKNRIIAGFIIFFVPTIIGLVLTAMGDDNRVSECWNNANPDVYEALDH